MLFKDDILKLNNEIIFCNDTYIITEKGIIYNDNKVLFEIELNNKLIKECYFFKNKFYFILDEINDILCLNHNNELIIIYENKYKIKVINDGFFIISLQKLIYFDEYFNIKFKTIGIPDIKNIIDNSIYIKVNAFNELQAIILNNNKLQDEVNLNINIIDNCYINSKKFENNLYCITLTYNFLIFNNNEIIYEYQSKNEIIKDIIINNNKIYILKLSKIVIKELDSNYNLIIKIDNGENWFKIDKKIYVSIFDINKNLFNLKLL